MDERNGGVTADPVFVGVTRPPMRFGVTYSALLVNAAFTMEAFIFTKNPLTFLVALPIHGVSMLLIARDARYFDLLFLWCKTRLLGHLCSLRYWKGASYSPLTLDLPTANGKRTDTPIGRLHPLVRNP